MKTKSTKFTLAAVSLAVASAFAHASDVTLQEAPVVEDEGTQKVATSNPLLVQWFGISAPQMRASADKTITGNANNSGGFMSGSDLTIEASGSLTNNKTIQIEGETFTGGQVHATGTLTNKGTMKDDGTGTWKIGTLDIQSTGKADIGDLTTTTVNNAGTMKVKKHTANGNITNSGTMTIETLATKDGITYTQTGDTAGLTVTNGWFNNSTLNIQGGKLARSDFGHNTLNISGTNQGDSAQNKTLVSADTLTSDTTVNLNKGGTFTVGTINLTNSQKTLNVKGGRLETSLDQFFSDVKKEVHDLEATDPNDKVNLVGNYVPVSSIGALKDSLKNGMSVTGGTIAFTDSSFGTSIANDALGKINAAYGSSLTGDQLEIAFTGKGSGDFTLDIANAIINDNPSTYASFLGNELKNTASGQAKQNLVVGTLGALGDTYGVLNDSMGFKYIDGAERVVVNNGKTLVLVGDETQSIDLVKSVAGTSEVTVNGNSKLMLGSYGKAKPTKGQIKTVSLDTGTLNIRNGEFTIDTLKNNGKTATVQIEDGATLTMGEAGLLDTGSTVSVAGTLAGTAALKGTTTVTGKVNTTALTTGGTFTTEAAGTLNTATLTVDGGNLINKGTATVSGTGTIKTGATLSNEKTLTIAAGTIGGTLDTKATGTTTQSGALTVSANGSIKNAGIFNANGNLSVAKDGSITNTAKGDQSFIFSFAKSVAHNIAGLFTNSGVVKSDAAQQGTLTIAEGGKFDNTATSVTNLYTASLVGGELANAEGGQVTIKDFNGDKGTVKSATVANNGTMNIEQFTLTDGAITGTGTLDLGHGNVSSLQTSQVGAQGSIAQGTLLVKTAKLNSAGTIDVDNLQTNKGVVTSGTFSADNVTLGDGFTIEAGHTTFGTVTVDANRDITNKGTFDVTGVFTGAQAKLINNGASAQMNIKGATANLDTITNTDGTLTVAATTTLKTLTNADQATITGKLVAQTLNNNTNGNLTMADGAVKSFKNQATASASGAVEVAQIVQGADATVTFNDALKITKNSTLGGWSNGAMSTNDGTIVAKGNVTFDSSTFTNNKAFTAEKDFAINGTFKNDVAGSTLNAATATLGAGEGKLYNSGTATIGTLTMASTGATLKSQLFGMAGSKTALTTLNMDAKSEIQNEGALTVANLAKATDVKYTQKGNGSIKVTTGWFEGSELRIEGGVIDTKDISTGKLGANTYIVKGTAAPSFPENGSQDTSWQDGQTKIIADELTSETTMTLEQGGLLDVNSIKLTAGKTLNLAGGTIVTSLSNFFDGVSTSVVGLEAMDESGHVDIETTVLASTGVKNFKDQVAANMNLNIGHIAFDNQFFSASLVNDVTQKMGKDYKNVTVHFTGTMDKVFTLDIAQSLVDEQPLESPIRNPGVVFDTTTLYAQSSDGQVTTLEVGGTDAKKGLTTSMGFQNVEYATGANIHGGKELALVGWTDNQKQDTNLFAGNTADSTIAVTGAGSKFTMGSDGLAVKTYGSVGTVTLADTGSAVVKNGTFKIAKIEAQNGTLDVKASGEANVADMALTATGKVSNNGHLILNAFSDVVGSTIENVGNLTAKVANTLKGTMTNTGVAKYEAGLTVAGSFTNGSAAAAKLDAFTAGTQTTDLTVQEGGSFVNHNVLIATGDVNVTGNNALRGEANSITRIDGTLTINGGAVSSLAGSDVNGVRNEGTMKVGTIDIQSGELRNWKDGILQGTSLNIAASGTLTNAGTTLVDTMTANGTLRNVGTLVLGQGTVSDFLANGANIQIKEQLTVAQGATLENKVTTKDVDGGMFGEGELLLTADSTFNNMAMFAMNKVTVEDGAKAINTNTFKANDVTIKGNTINGDMRDGQYVDGKTIAGTVTMDGGKLTNRGTYTAQNLVFGKGTVEALGGTFETAAVEFGKDGIFKVASDGSNGEAKAYLEMANGAKIDGQVIVEKGSMTFGNKASFDKNTTDAIADIKRGATLFVGANNITVNGKLAVGTGAEKQMASMADGGMWFGGDSLLVLDTSKINEEVGAFLGNGTNSSLSVEDGAKIHFAQASWGKHYIAKNVDTEHVSDKAWVDDLITSSGLNKDANYVIDADKDGIFVTVGSNNIQDAMPNIVMPNIVNAVMASSDRHNVKTGTIGAIASALELEQGADDVLNSMAGIGYAAQTLRMATSHADRVSNATERHLSFEDYGFNDGQLVAHDAPVFWADALISQTKTDGAQVAGNLDTDGKVTSGGFIFGTDVISVDKGLRFGASMAFQRGDVKTEGLTTKTTNDVDTYGFNAYGAYTVGNFNFIGNVGYAHSKNDIEQSLDVTKMGKSTADVKANIYTAGLRAEAMYGVGDLQIIPHLGVRLTHIDQDGYTAKVGGADAFKYDAEKNTLVQMPIGVTLRNTTAVGGWALNNTLDLSVIPTMGDKDSDTKVKAMGVSDTFSSNFADDVKGEARLGIQAQKGNFTFGAEYGFGTSDTTKAEHSVSVKARYAF